MSHRVRRPLVGRRLQLRCCSAWRGRRSTSGVSLIVPVLVFIGPAPFDYYDAGQFKRGSEMPQRPDVGAIAKQVSDRLKQIEDQVTENQRIADALGRLRDAVKDREREIASRFGGDPLGTVEPTERAPRQRAAKRSRVARRSR